MGNPCTQTGRAAQVYHEAHLSLELNPSSETQSLKLEFVLIDFENVQPKNLTALSGRPPRGCAA